MVGCVRARVNVCGGGEVGLGRVCVCGGGGGGGRGAAAASTRSPAGRQVTRTRQAEGSAGLVPLIPRCPTVGLSPAIRLLARRKPPQSSHSRAFPLPSGFSPAERARAARAGRAHLGLQALRDGLVRGTQAQHAQQAAAVLLTWRQGAAHGDRAHQAQRGRRAQQRVPRLGRLPPPGLVVGHADGQRVTRAAHMSAGGQEGADGSKRCKQRKPLAKHTAAPHAGGRAGRTSGGSRQPRRAGGLAGALGSDLAGLRGRGQDGCPNGLVINPVRHGLQ